MSGRHLALIAPSFKQHVLLLMSVPLLSHSAHLRIQVSYLLLQTSILVLHLLHYALRTLQHILSLS